MGTSVKIDPTSPDWFLPGFFAEDHRVDGFYGPARMIVIAPSGAGKSFAITDLLLSYGKKLFMKLWLFSNNLDQKPYKLLEQRIYDNYYLPISKLVEGFKFEDIFFKSDNPDDIPPLKDMDAEIRNFVIFDDFLGNRDVTIKAREYYVQGRHHNVTVCYLAQRYTATDIVIREQANYAVLFRTNMASDITLFHQKYAQEMSLDQFKRMFRNATSEKYSFMTIDLTASDYGYEFKYRKKFDEPITPQFSD
ncbi:MAG: hypothetical protein KAS32_21315 [Candidatus Peribacteraceae bacterium]|nr:hypothetical protein [Candidatus Peribacteraceae bacterium]